MIRNNSLRARLDQGLLSVAPGAPDALTARLVQQAGFDAVYVTRLGTTIVRLGMPDLEQPHLSGPY